MAMSELRDKWRAAKDEVKKNLVLSDEMKKMNLGPLLDAAVAAEEAFDKLMDKLAKAPDQKNEDKARQEALKAFPPARKAAGEYMNALRGIERARPEQAAAAKKLGGVLMIISNTLQKTQTRVKGS